MRANAALQRRPAPGASIASSVEAVFAYERAEDAPRVLLIPRPEIDVMVRFGAAARGGLDGHAFGARQRVGRKILRGVQRTVTARLRLGAPERVLGVPASAIAGRVVALEDLWGEAATRRLFDRLAGAHDALEAASILESAIAERLEAADARPASLLALAAAEKLREGSNIHAIADDLAVSDRHLRRVFRDTFGISPKAFAKLSRFHRALRAARSTAHHGWANIATAAGYYDQAHLIADFRAIAGVTPRALLDELRASRSILD